MEGAPYFLSTKWHIEQLRKARTVLTLEDGCGPGTKAEITTPFVSLLRTGPTLHKAHSQSMPNTTLILTPLEETFVLGKLSLSI
jgi:hypothetical protein